jgi:hypothetical protein
MTPRIPVPPGWPTAQPAGAGGQVPGAPWTGQQQQWQGQRPPGWTPYSYPAATPRRVGRASRLSHRSLLAILSGLVAGFVVILIIVSVASSPAAPSQCQGLTCAAPLKTGPPVATGPLYANSQFGFTARVIESPILGIAPTASTANNQLTLTYSQSGNEIGTVQLEGVADSNGETAEQIVESTVNQVASGQQQLVYTLGGAMVGYQPGFGAVYSVTPDSGDGQSNPVRVIVMASVEDNLAIVAVATGIFSQFDSSNGDGHPSPADTPIAIAGDPVIDSVLWPGQTSLFGSS